VVTAGPLVNVPAGHYPWEDFKQAFVVIVLYNLALLLDRGVAAAWDVVVNCCGYPSEVDQLPKVLFICRAGNFYPLYYPSVRYVPAVAGIGAPTVAAARVTGCKNKSKEA